jgi:hypothetical protein
MKAKIYNSVEITEVPAKIQERLQETSAALCEVCDMNTTSYHVLNLDMEKSSNVQCVVESITQTRNLMMEADRALSECLELVTGYKNYVTSNEEADAKKELLSKALSDQERQAKVPPPVAVSGDPEPPVNPITKELLDKIAELSDVNEG